MSERKLLFLMNAEQAEAFTRLVQAEHGGGDAACRLRDMYREGLGGLSRPPWRRLIHNAPASTISSRDRLGRIPKAGDRPFSANRMTHRLWPGPAGQAATTKQPFTILDGSYGLRMRSARPASVRFMFTA